MADYDVITANNSIYRLSSGETFSNKLIDMRNGRWYMIHSPPGVTNWTIRNVGFIGRHRYDRNPIQVLDTNRNGVSRIENVWMGDGMRRAHNYASHGQVGVFVHKDHRGTIKIDRLNVQGMPNNGVYANAPYKGGRGKVQITNSYGANNYVSQFRVGTTGSYVRDSVCHLDSNWYNGRGLWLWGGSSDNVDVRRCHCHMNGRHTSLESWGGTANIYSTQYDRGFRNGTNVENGGRFRFHSGNGSSPRNFIPNGCPRTAIEAASGETTTQPPPSPDPDPSPEPDPATRTFFVTGEGAYPPSTTYEFRTTGQIIRSTANNATIDDEDYVREANDGTGHWIGGGETANWRDSFHFQGDLLDVERDGPARIYVDGTAINPNDYNWEPTPDPTPDPDPEPDPEPEPPEEPPEPIGSDPAKSERRYGSMWARRDFGVDLTKGEERFSSE